MALVVPRPTSSSDQFPAYPIINWMSPLLIWIAKRESKVNEFVGRGIHGLFFFANHGLFSSLTFVYYFFFCENYVCLLVLE
jgi:hypothetical protein